MNRYFYLIMLSVVAIGFLFGLWRSDMLDVGAVITVLLVYALLFWLGFRQSKKSS